MTDTYNDTTGSRKKFLIPLVVLLLCAVSLTGAGYAYQSSVTLEGNTGGVDEYFTIDLYDGENVIVEAVDVGKVDGLLVTTVKNVDGQTLGITGSFAKENFNVVLYQGKFMLNTANLNASASATVVASGVEAELASTTIYAEKVNDAWQAADAQTQGAHQFTVANPTITPGTVAFFADEQCSVPVQGAFDVDTAYYFQIPVTAFTGTVTEVEVQDVDKITAAEEFAKAVVAALKITFNFTLTATAVEDQCALALNAMGGADQEFAIAVGDSELENFVAPTIQGKTLQGFFTQTTGGTKVIEDDGSFVVNVNGYTDNEGKWAAVGPVTLYAQWEANP